MLVIRDTSNRKILSSIIVAITHGMIDESAATIIIRSNSSLMKRLTGKLIIRFSMKSLRMRHPMASMMASMIVDSGR